MRDEPDIEIYDPREDMANFEVYHSTAPQDDLEATDEDD